MPKATSSSCREDEESQEVIRRKRNTISQAAFRQRQNEQIANLNKKGMSTESYFRMISFDDNPSVAELETRAFELECTIDQMEDTCHEHIKTTETLQHEVTLLKHEGRERERIWTRVWAAFHRHPPPVPESTLFGAVQTSPSKNVNESSPPSSASSHIFEESYSNASDGSCDYGGSSLFVITSFPCRDAEY
jgi:hypothetical protein